jgi:hypothetical protein
MNLQEQIGALETGVDQLIQAALAAQAAPPPAPEDAPVAAPIASAATGSQAAGAETAADDPAAAGEPTAADEPVAADGPSAAGQPALHVARPAQNEITLTIGGQTVSLPPEQVGQLIEELANARASMTPEPPVGLPPGWRFVSTKNPVMAVQKQSNGDRLLVARHTGHGWVPFTFSPDMVIQLYMMLTQR